MGRIHRLSDDLANQIAAGEVVERPASVVKELVENALDAGATRVVVDVEQGGVVLVRITDDGEGMSAEDAVLALERHATSKIAKLEDLERIGTFGFRGEALPSIASVSRLALRTRLRGTSEGCRVVVEGGGAPRVEPAGGAEGTSIEVRELFFNVPARRKFLKATATESAHVGDVVLGAALARPDVTFVLSRDGRVVREYLRVGSREERARAALGQEPLVACPIERGLLRGFAMLAPPERARAGATGLSLLVNGRPVRDRFLARAVAQAYGSVLEGGRYPLGVVWIDVPCEVVDVNVHPQKAEVRFADARGIFDGITRELHVALARAFGLPPLGPAPQANTPTAAFRFRPFESRPYGAPSSTASPPRTASSALAALALSSPAPTTLPLASPLPQTNLFAARPVAPVASDASDAPSAAAPDGNAAERPPGDRGLYASLRFVGQVHATYLLCEGDDALYIIDQHAAAERITFDRLRRAHAQRGVAAQRLLVPEVLELPAQEVALLESAADEVSKLGIEVRAVGETAVAVHALPEMLARAEPTRVVQDLAAELARTAGRPLSGRIDLVLATMACHGSVRAGDRVAPEEAEALLRALDTVEFAGHCPHGRPLVMRLPWGELERRVGR